MLLRRRAREIRIRTGDSNIFAPIEVEKKGVKQMLTVTLARPMLMFAEPLVLCACLYLALEYAIFYLFFEAYPIVFQGENDISDVEAWPTDKGTGIYRMSAGIAALALIPGLLSLCSFYVQNTADLDAVAIGAILACLISLWYDRILRRAKERQAPWSMSEEYRRLPLACVGGPLHVVSLFWLVSYLLFCAITIAFQSGLRMLMAGSSQGWTARADIHWIVPMLAGIPFGIGIELTFISLLNYLTDAYEIFAASAMASSAFSRSIFAVMLPLAADPLYKRLGVAWASSLLGFLSFTMAISPFILIKYGDLIRRRSKFCQHLLEQKRNANARTH